LLKAFAPDTWNIQANAENNRDTSRGERIIAFRIFFNKSSLAKERTIGVNIGKNHLFIDSKKISLKLNALFFTLYLELVFQA